MLWKFVHIGLFLVVGFGSLTPVQAQRAELDQEEYDQKLMYLNSRYKDFYLHRKGKERRLQKLLDSAGSMRQQRKELDQVRERQRQAFVKKRASMPTPENYEPAYLKKVERREKAQEKARLQYIRRRKTLERIRESARSIPETEESGLDDPLEDLR
ncbi:MAG: hypothetical protein H6624_07670 [Bdellovibrionaceae bacterium]|nr:hypothetical protein [Bdellovibrionales bacterium]MCB9084208.1 hypothetical protein [Pseudobdellovibrionaceae bacterium]